MVVRQVLFLPPAVFQLVAVAVVAVAVVAVAVVAVAVVAVVHQLRQIVNFRTDGHHNVRRNHNIVDKECHKENCTANSSTNSNSNNHNRKRRDFLLLLLFLLLLPTNGVL